MERKYITQQLYELMGEAASNRNLDELKKESEKLYNALKADLSDAMNGHGDIYITRTIDRKIGKTYTLIKLACKYNLPIMVKGNLARLYERDALEILGKSICVIPVYTNSHARRERFDIVLKDEGISTQSVIDYFKPAKVKVVGISSFFDD